MECGCRVVGVPGHQRYELCGGHQDIVDKSVAAEREACAKIAETMDYSIKDFGPAPAELPRDGNTHFYGVCTFDTRDKDTPLRIASAIRART